MLSQSTTRRKCPLVIKPINLHLRFAAVALDSFKNSKCNEHIQDTRQFLQFLKLSIVDQIQLFFDEPDFTDLLSYRFHRIKQNDESIEDVFDGALYQRLHKDSGILGKKMIISLKVNTDYLNHHHFICGLSISK